MSQGTLNRQTTHRPEREPKQTPKERQLESEVKHLQRQLAKARKALLRAEDRASSAIEDEDEQTPQPQSEPAQICPGCKSGDLKELDLGFKVYLCCDNCKYRSAA